MSPSPPGRSLRASTGIAWASDLHDATRSALQLLACAAAFWYPSSRLMPRR